MLFLAPLAMGACGNVEPVLEYGGSPGTAFVIEVEGNRKVYETRSILSGDDIETKVTDVSLAAYDGDGILIDAKYYESDFSMMSLALGTGGSCNVYALANMGDMTGDFPLSESDVPLMEYVLSSYEEIEAQGIPMCGKEPVHSSSGEAVINLDRLFAKVCVRIRHTGLYDYAPDALTALNMCNRSIYVRQANSRLRPFLPEGSRAESTADIMDVSDYNPDLTDKGVYSGPSSGVLTYGAGYLQDVSLVLYVPENAQGCLLPDNRDPFGKVYGNIGNIGGKSYGDLCTYIEFNASRAANQGYSGSLMYRYYLGADNTSDFNVERNCRYNLTLDFTEDGIFADSWKVTRGDDWSDSRVLYFLENPYKVTPGGTENVMVHFHRFTSSVTSSQPFPERWVYVMDEEAMADAGLSVSYDPNTLVTGANGYKDFCLKISASDDARVGSYFPITVMTTDGSIVDHTTITVAGNSPLDMDWNVRPEYVSQYGTFSVTGYEASDLPLSFSVSDASRIRCVKTGDGTFRVVALDAGSISVTVSNYDGSKSVSADLDIKAPFLNLGRSHVELNPDGEAVQVSYEYRTEAGSLLSGIDQDVYDSVLKPVVSDYGYFGTDLSEDAFDIYVCRLEDGGNRILAGSSYGLDVSAAECTAVESERLNVTVTDPFAGFVSVDRGRIDDYTLFGLSGVNSRVAAQFTDEISSNRSFTFDVPTPDADPSYVTAELVPRWKGEFSYANGVYSSSWNRATGRVTVTQNTVTSSTTHSAGLHDVMMVVRNRHSSETISGACGTFDVYVHAGIGADASFSKAQCCQSYGGLTFAEVYNSLAGRAVYLYPQSESYIHYMDVTMKWITSVSGVYVLEKVRSRLPAYDALTFLRPGREDGEVANEMLFSVYQGTDERTSVCGEPGGGRAGVGHILYRALLVRTFDYEQSETNLRKLFFGYESGSASGVFSPAYKVFDCENVEVSTMAPYNFSPSICAEYKDGEGEGYHVLHFLESVVPATCGWMNLL